MVISFVGRGRPRVRGEQVGKGNGGRASYYFESWKERERYRSGGVERCSHRIRRRFEDTDFFGVVSGTVDSSEVPLVRLWVELWCVWGGGGGGGDSKSLG